MMLCVCDICNKSEPAPVIAGEWGYPIKWFQLQALAIETDIAVRHACSAKCFEELKARRKRAQAATVTQALPFGD